MVLRTASAVLALCPLALLVACASAAERQGDRPAEGTPEPAAAAGAAPAAPPATVAATKGPFTVVLDLKGTFDAIGPVEVQFVPLLYSDELEILEAAPPGPVEKGRPLARFKTEKIDDQIRNAELALAIAKTGLQRQEEEAARQEEAAAVALARTERDSREADQSLKVFQEVEMPLQLEQSALGLLWEADWIQDQVEELAQLEKMYKADDLTEETEEIVMRRARRSLERAKTSQAIYIKWSELLRTVELPRRLENLKLEQRRMTVEREKATATWKPSLAQSKLELDRARLSFSQQEEQFRKLGKDRESFTLTAPAAGVAVPGSLVRGKWTDMDGMARELRPGHRVRGNQVLYTIVRPGEVQVVSSLPESALFDVAEGMEAKVTPAAAPGAKLTARVSRVSRVSTGNEYEISLDLQGGDPRLMPGNSCTLKLTTATRPDAVTVPSASVVEEGEKRFVHVWADGKTERKDVTVGAVSAGRTEILTGVSEGEKVLTSPPK